MGRMRRELVGERRRGVVRIGTRDVSGKEPFFMVAPNHCVVLSQIFLSQSSGKPNTFQSVGANLSRSSPSFRHRVSPAVFCFCSSSVVVYL